MKKAVIEIDRSQLINALEQLPGADIKKIMDELFLKKLFKKPDFDSVSAKARRVVRKQGIGPEVVEEAIRWARRQK